MPSCVTWGGQTRPQGAHRILREEVREAPAKMHTALGLAHLTVRRPAWVRGDPHGFPAVCRDFVSLHLTVAHPSPPTLRTHGPGTGAPQVRSKERVETASTSWPKSQNFFSLCWNFFLDSSADTSTVLDFTYVFKTVCTTASVATPPVHSDSRGPSSSR